MSCPPKFELARRARAILAQHGAGPLPGLAAMNAEQMAEVLAALVAVLAITAAALVAAGPLIRLLGDKVEAVITRLLGVLLAALAAQYVIDGLKGSFGI